jgi:trimethylamine corrinoid protein
MFSMSTDILLEQMSEAIVKADIEDAVRLAEQAIARGLDPIEAIEKGYAKGMQIVGDKFEELELFLPDMMRSAKAMEAAVEVLKKSLEDGQKNIEPLGTIVLGTIKGDVHDIGKNIVKTMLSAVGFVVYDIGKDIQPAAFIQKAQEVNADIIGVSALMTSTMLHMPDIVRELKELGIKDKYKVVFGGAPVLPDWAKNAGADGWGGSAAEAVNVCKELVGKGRL